MFPYKDAGKRLDRATSDLVIFGQLLFSFNNDFSFCMPFDAYLADNKFEGLPYKRSLINKRLYLALKADCSSKRHSKWLRTDHMDLVCQWFLWNDKFNVLDCCKVI